MFHRTIAKLAWDFSWPRRASVCLAVLMALIGHPAAADKRVALVIGSGAYTKVPQLPNPPHDAAAIADMLRKAGFQIVTSKTDLGVEATRRELRDFSDEVRDADIAVVFYAGHGMEMKSSRAQRMISHTIRVPTSSGSVTSWLALVLTNTERSPARCSKRGEVKQG
jgi:hypothetical protein